MRNATFEINLTIASGELLGIVENCSKDFTPLNHIAQKLTI